MLISSMSLDALRLSFVYSWIFTLHSGCCFRHHSCMWVSFCMSDCTLARKTTDRQLMWLGRNVRRGVPGSDHILRTCDLDFWPWVRIAYNLRKHRSYSDAFYMVVYLTWFRKLNKSCHVWFDLLTLTSILFRFKYCRLKFVAVCRFCDSLGHMVYCSCWSCSWLC